MNDTYAYKQNPIFELIKHNHNYHNNLFPPLTYNHTLHPPD
jgi:hypothetical protein